jgi:hypothetical protein
MVIDTAPESLARLQTSFAAHIRDPAAAPAPDGIEDRRVAIYRELFFNNIRSFLSSNFPVLKSLHNTDSWDTLCRDFYRDFRSQTPLFPEIPREFLRYLQEHRQDHPFDPPFMLELAHYEWVELALSLDETDATAIHADSDGDLVNGIPFLSPLAWALSYQYPVHRIRLDYQPTTAPPEATHLLVWRRRDYSIKFMRLNPVSALLVQKLKENTTHTGLELLTALAGEIGHPQPGVVVEAGRDLLQEFKGKEIVPGTRRP